MSVRREEILNDIIRRFRRLAASFLTIASSSLGIDLAFKFAMLIIASILEVNEESKKAVGDVIEQLEKFREEFVKYLKKEKVDGVVAEYVVNNVFKYATRKEFGEVWRLVSRKEYGEAAEKTLEIWKKGKDKRYRRALEILYERISHRFWSNIGLLANILTQENEEEILKGLEELLNRMDPRVNHLHRLSEELKSKRYDHNPLEDFPPKFSEYYGWAVLKANYAVVPYVGEKFQNKRDEIVKWAENLAENSQRLGIGFIYGSGGIGKTRLAVEVAKMLEGKEWETYRIESDGLKALKEVGHLIFNPPVPTLYVLDYAESLPRKDLEEFIKKALRIDNYTHPVAFLLLSRLNPKEWFDFSNLKEGGLEQRAWVVENNAKWVDMETVLGEILSESGEDFFKKLFSEALSKFREIYNLKGETIPKKEEDKDKKKEDIPKVDLPRRPLPVVLLAFLHAHGICPKDSGNEKSVFKEFWDSYLERRINRALGGLRNLDDDQRKYLNRSVKILILASTLGYAMAMDSKDELINTYTKLQNVYPYEYDNPPTWGDLKRVLKKLFPNHSQVPKLEPDPIADYVFMEKANLNCLKAALKLALPDREKASPEEVASRIYDVMNIIARAFARDVMRWREEGVGKGRVEALREVIKEYLDKVPEAKLSLGDKLLFTQNPTLIAVFKTVVEDSVEEAVKYYREFANKNPDRFLPDLAMALNNLGNRYFHLGRYEEALKPAKEAVKYYRELAEENPDRFLPDLAGALNDLGAIYSNLGRYEEALEPTEEAVKYYREFANKNPDRFLPDLAIALNDLGVIYSNLRRYEEALKPTGEAVKYYRELVNKNSDRFLPYLAMALNDLGDRYFHLGRYEEALKPTEEAVKYYRELAKKNPDWFMPDLATALFLKAIVFLKIGGRENCREAMEHLEAAFNILLPYYNLYPQRWGPLMAAIVSLILIEGAKEC